MTRLNRFYFVVRLREKIVPEVKNLAAPGIQNGSQTLVMWKNRRMATNRRRYDPGALQTPSTQEEQTIAAADKSPVASLQLTGRTFLRGAGVVMALPWLESLPVWGADSAASSLSRRIGAEDNRKLDEFLTSVREVEKRVDRMRSDQVKAEENARDRGKVLLAMNRPDNGLPEDIRDHMRLMSDVVALAFQTGKGRVATLVLCRDLSGLFYPFLGVRKAHHSASHDDTSDDYESVSRYYVSNLAYLASRLDAMPEGEGTVLDNTCLLYLSNMWSGTRHDNTRLPVLTVGGLGGTLKTGRVLDYTEAGDENRKLCSLHLSLMDRMGVSLPRFGDADTRLASL